MLRMKALVQVCLLVTAAVLLASVFRLHYLTRPSRHQGFLNALDTSLTTRMKRAEQAWLASSLKRDAQLSKVDVLVDSDLYVHVDSFDGKTLNLSRFPVRRDLKSNGGLETVWDYFSPAYSCPWELERIGRLGDGGKWVCGMSQYEQQELGRPLIYSLGISNESSFEAEMLNRTKGEVLGFDHTVGQMGVQVPFHLRSRAKFSRLKVGAADGLNIDGGPIRTIPSIMKQNHHEYIDILKVDIEGSEFDVLRRFMDDARDEFLPVGQLLMELHLFDDVEMSLSSFRKWWDMLEQLGFRAVSREINLRPAAIAKGVPRASEYTWINTKAIESGKLGLKSK